jgi:hypothetical protein
VRYRRGRTAALLLALTICVGAVAGIATILVVKAASRGVTTATSRLTSAYLMDIETGRYAQAYQRLCPDHGLIPAATFAQRLAQAQARGHGVHRFRVHPTFVKESLHLTAATGSVAFADGSSTQVYYEDGRSSGAGSACLAAYDDFTDY